jgi:hypothetical protein
MRRVLVYRKAMPIFKQGHPSGWAHLKLEPNAGILELRCLDPNHPAHRQTHRLEWRA